MNTLSKIFLSIIIFLVITLCTMTILFFNMKNVALLNYNAYKQSSELVNQLQNEKNITEEGVLK